MTFSKNESDQMDLERLIKESAQRPFLPYVEYDIATDILRIELEDCSYTTEQITPNIALLHRNHNASLSCVGVVIQSLQEELNQFGLSLKNINVFVKLLDDIVKDSPDVVQSFLNGQFTRLVVNLSEFTE